MPLQTYIGFVDGACHSRVEFYSKLSTNMTMNPQFANLGWTFSIYNDENGNERSQDYNPGNSDVVVSLKDGEIITTSFMNSNYYDTKISDDNAKLIFTTVK